MVGYRTSLGTCINGDSLELIKTLDDESIDLIVTSPPFSLQRHKSYGEVEQSEYVDWLLQFGKAVYPKLKNTGSLVMDIGGAYQKGRPVKSLYPFRFLLRMCDELGYNLCQDFYWHNVSALPAPIQYVNKEKIRCKTSVNTVWWFGKTDRPKADVKNVLTPYSERMQKLLKNPDSFYTAGAERPSGHVMGKSWQTDNGGAIPPNLLQISNSESNSQYLRYCKALGLKGHPARYCERFVEFFIKFLTDEGDTVLDIFSGSNTTGSTAEKLNRHWLSFELDREFVASSSFRFVSSEEKARLLFDEIMNKDEIVLVD